MNRITCSPLVVAACICINPVAPQPAFSQDVVVRTTTTPQTTASLGQRIVFKVDVLGKDAWARLPSPPSVQVPGAIVFMPPNQSVRLNEQIENASYTGQRYEWWIYPQRTGEVVIPKTRLSIDNKVFGNTEQREPVEKTTDEVRLSIQRPPEMPPGNDVTVTNNMQVYQAWSSQPESLTVGDGITRTITRTIQDAPSLLLPPFDFDDIDGVRTIVKQPSTQNSINRGDLVGRRRDEVTYVFQSAGEITVPLMDVTWFDPDSGQHETETLNGWTLTITPSHEDKLGEADTFTGGQPQPSKTIWVGVAATCCLIVGWLAFSFREPIEQWFAGYVHAVAGGEAAHFKRFESSARGGIAADTLRDLVRWSDVVQSNEPAPRLDRLFAMFGKASAVEQLNKLQEAVDQGTANFDSGTLVKETKSVRRSIKHSHDHRLRQQCSPLPPLRASVMAGHETD